MVRITYTGWKEVRVHEILELDSQTFFEDIVRLTLAQGIQVQPSVNWVDGIAFVSIPMADTQEVVREKLKGILHFASVMFTRTSYRDTFTIRIANSDLSVKLRKTTNPLLLQLAAYIRDFKPESVQAAPAVVKS